MEPLGRSAMPNREQQLACMTALATAFADLREQALTDLHLWARHPPARCWVRRLRARHRHRPARATGGRVGGVDLNADTINSARAATAEAGVAVDFRVGDIRDLPCAEHEFDAVRCERVFQHATWIGPDFRDIGARSDDQGPRTCLQLLRVP
jgi:hypothetical protein